MLTAKEFNQNVSEKEQTAAQLELIEEALKKALLRHKAFGEKQKGIGITIPFFKKSCLTEEAKDKILKAGFIFLPPLSKYDYSDPLVLGFKETE